VDAVRVDAIIIGHEYSRHVDFRTRGANSDYISRA
jgi:hypothetical protein